MNTGWRMQIYDMTPNSWNISQGKKLEDTSDRTGEMQQLWRDSWSFWTSPGKEPRFTCEYCECTVYSVFVREKTGALVSIVPKLPGDVPAVWRAPAQGADGPAAAALPAAAAAAALPVVR